MYIIITYIQIVHLIFLIKAYNIGELGDVFLVCIFYAYLI